jgi:hypothetical protein
LQQSCNDRGPVAKVVRRHTDGIMCRAAGLPLLLALFFVPKHFDPATLAIGRAYADRFWRVRAAGEWFDIVAGILLWPLGVLIAALWFTYRNGTIVAAQSGRSVLGQFGDQLRLAVTAGVLPAWYYVFELYKPGRISSARAYLTRGQTKRGAYRVFAETRGSSSPLSDKAKFAEYCAERQLPTIPVLLSASDGALMGPIQNPESLPQTDLFVKPIRGRGGRGAERWDYLAGGLYRHVEGETLSAEQFLDRLRRMSVRMAYLVQERVRNHPAIVDLSNGALNTVRVISCLDEQERPEVIGAVLRMAVGRNVTVDNVHAGGLAAAVDLGSGRLGQATGAGMDARFGWMTRHPDTGARIAGRTLPMWDDVLDLVRRAHAAFRDWVVIGWDVAIRGDGACLVEGNCGPDVDLIQRPLGAPFGSGRFGELLAFHLQRAQSPVFRPSISPARKAKPAAIQFASGAALPGANGIVGSEQHPNVQGQIVADHP